jgi:SNF2 family DNA or RNA helicase
LQSYHHQVEALDAMRGRAAFALLMSMRTGKSKVILDEWQEDVDQRGPRDLLVVAPAGSYRGWEGEVKKHVGMPVEQLTWDSQIPVSGRGEFVRWASSKFDRPRMMLVNVEAFSTVEVAREACFRFLESNQSTFVVDESTTIKNPDSLRTKHVCALAPKAKQRRILSGLPTPTSPLDLFAQYWFLDPAILRANNFEMFKRRYAITRKMRVGGRWMWPVVGYKNTDELNGKIAPHSFRRTLRDCYDVPDKVYVRRDVELTDEQKRLYHDIKTKATTRLSTGEHVTATEVIVQMLRLHQLCCGWLIDEEKNRHEVPSNRMAELMQCLGECDGKVVIWCSYRHDLERIAKKLRDQLGDAAVAVFYGGNKDSREDDSKRFEEDPACTRMVATPGAGGRGRTWAVADILIYWSNTDNLEHRDQSEERASIVGKTQPVTVVDLITPGTVEEKIVQNLRAKITMAGKITGDNYREWLI